MRYHQLVENQNDDDMFAPSDVTHANLRRTTFPQRIPEMIRRVQQGLLANADRLARSMATEFVREARFLEKEEVYELAREVFTHEAPQHLHQALAILSEDPGIIEDEDRMSDTLATNNIFTDIRNDSELWAYTSEMLEEFAEGDENLGDLEYHLAMEIEGTVGNLMISLIQQAYAETPMIGENIDDDDLFSNSPKIVRRGELTKQHINRKTVADKKGIAVGAKIKFLMPNGRYYTGRVVKLLPSGRIKVEYKINGIKYDRSLSPHNVRPEHVIGEDSDDDMFSTRKTPMPRGHNFVIYVNNRPRGKAVSVDNAVDRATRYIAAVVEANPEARVNIQIVDDWDGEVMWSGGSGFEGKYYNRGKYMEAFPQPGESSGKAKQFNPSAKVQTKEMTLDQILSTVKGIPYVNNVIDDWDAKDYSWNVTKKVIEYAQYLQKNPQSVANLPPLVVIDGRLDDGAHRLSAINLLQKRMDPKNPLWKQVKLKVNFGTSADVASGQGMLENFADGKVKGKSRPGRVKRAGASCNGSVTDLRARAKNASGEKAKMYHWCANMKSGRKKANEASPTGLEFKGYPCTKDCSGHQAGHDWAERWGIQDPDGCTYSNNSFWEGCLSYTDDFQDNE